MDTARQSHRDEDLYAFGNKERIRALQLRRDLGVDSPDSIVGPCSQNSPRDNDDVVGPLAFVDPDRAPLDGHFHVLPKEAKVPPGLGMHANGEDAGGDAHWGHRLIYPTEAMIASGFQELVSSLDWTS